MCVIFIDSFDAFHEASYSTPLPLDVKYLKPNETKSSPPPPPTRWLQMELREISLPRVMSLESEPVMAEDYKFQSEGGKTGGVESVMLQ